jgi:L-aspartate oxidase
MLKEYNLINSLDKIPVSPAAHFSIGGIEADSSGKTNIKGIFCVGEASCTGVHGANRLASNSLLECITFGAKTGYSVFLYNMYNTIKNIRIKNEKIYREKITDEEKYNILSNIKDTMWNNVGLLRNKETLEHALQNINNLIEEIKDKKDSYYLKDLLYLSKFVTLSALNRNESRGVHYRNDFPHEKEEYKTHTIIEINEKIKLEVN